MNYTSTSLKYVDHTYHDFSNYIIEGGELTKHKKSDNNFPARLHKLVSDGPNDVITWMVSLLVIYSRPNSKRIWVFVPLTFSSTPASLIKPHGRAWKILDKKRLVSEVIPNYYVCKKYESFTRQLNGWGFKRLHQTGPGTSWLFYMCACDVMSVLNI